MWIIRWTLIGVIVLLFLGFALQNAGLVQVTIWTWTSGEIPLYLVVYFAFACGFIVFLLATAVYQLQAQVETRRCRREIKRLQAELDRMRTVSLEEGLDDEDAGGGNSPEDGNP